LLPFGVLWAFYTLLTLSQFNTDFKRFKYEYYSTAEQFKYLISLTLSKYARKCSGVRGREPENGRRPVHRAAAINAGGTRGGECRCF
jgi:hypothetical protein